MNRGFDCQTPVVTTSSAQLGSAKSCNPNKLELIFTLCWFTMREFILWYLNIFNCQNREFAKFVYENWKNEKTSW